MSDAKATDAASTSTSTFKDLKSSPIEVAYKWAEVSDGKNHGFWIEGKFDICVMPWEAAWLQPRVFSGSKFATPFKLGDIYSYFQGNIIIDEKGRKRPSTEGFKEGQPGMVCVDLDREGKLDAALNDIRIIIKRLDAEGVEPNRYTIFFSGGKGFSMHFRAEAFGEEIYRASGTKDLLPHEHGVLLALRAVCADVVFDRTAKETMRLFRLPNSRHDKTGIFKIPLSHDEAMSSSIEQILRLAQNPTGCPGRC